MKKAFYLLFLFFFIVIAFLSALFIRFFLKTNQLAPKLVWGSDPIKNNVYWSKAMTDAGYESETYTYDFYASINKRSDWDRVISEHFQPLPARFKPYFAFLYGLFKYDIFFLSFNGFFIGGSPLRCFQAQLFRLAGKKTVILAYGSDSYVYKRIRSTSTVHALLMSYPLAAKKQNVIEKNVDYWVKNADVVVPGVMGPDGYGRWDVLLPSHLFIDLESWKTSTRYNNSEEPNGLVRIAHSPNHRGFKGTEFLIDAVAKLQEENLNVELVLFENLQNEEVKNSLQNKVDILVEQLICTGHGLNGLEGMASGIPTISNLENEDYVLPWRRWSYFSECPIVSATPENLVDVLRELITNPLLRKQLGRAGREYVEKYHGLDSAEYLFRNIIEYLYGKKKSLIDLYHPLLGAYPNRRPKIKHPLKNNKIID